MSATAAIYPDGFPFPTGSGLVVGHLVIACGESKHLLGQLARIEVQERVFVAQPTPLSARGLMLLKIDHEFARPGFSEQPPVVGMTVYAIGHPGGLKYSLLEGRISGIKKSSPTIQVQGLYYLGMEGAPLFDENGLVLGVLCGGFKTTGSGVGFAVPAGEIYKELEEY